MTSNLNSKWNQIWEGILNLSVSLSASSFLNVVLWLQKHIQGWICNKKFHELILHEWKFLIEDDKFNSLKNICQNIPDQSHSVLLLFWDFIICDSMCK